MGGCFNHSLKKLPRKLRSPRRLATVHTTRKATSIIYLGPAGPRSRPTARSSEDLNSGEERLHMTLSQLAINHYIENNQQRFLGRLRDLCRQPSVSATDFGIRECAKSVVIQLITPGSGPRFVFEKGLGLPVIHGGGRGYPLGRTHAPNENIRITDFVQSMKATAALIDGFSRVP